MAVRKRKIPINSVDEIPQFANEAEEDEFWTTHRFSDAMWDQAEPLQPDEAPPTRPRTKAVVLHLDEATLQRARVVAQRRHQGVQLVLAQLLTAALSDEERKTG